MFQESAIDKLPKEERDKLYEIFDQFMKELIIEKGDQDWSEETIMLEMRKKTSILRDKHLLDKLFD